MNNLGRGGYSLWSLENLGIKKKSNQMEKNSITSNDVSDIRFLIYFGKYFSASAKAIVRSCSVTKVFFKNFAKLTRKHLGCILFFNKKTPVQILSCDLYGIFNNTYFVTHLRKTASVSRISLENKNFH